MCFSSPKPTPTTKKYVNSQGNVVTGDIGLPQDAIDQGITTQAGYQAYTQQQIANQQIQAQKDIASQQETFNQQQLAAMQAQQAQQQQQVTDQANRQTTYDQGRAQQLADATNQINQAFGRFSPDYFNQYAQDYMSQVSDALNQQRTAANKKMLFGLARQGLSSSQELANETGLLDEAQGRTLAEQTQNALGAEAQLKSNVANARQGLIGQVQQAQAVGGPIAANTLGDVQSALNTQNQQISGITNSSGDIVASLNGVPTVSPLGDIFGGIIGNLGSYMGGVNAQNTINAYNNALGGLTGSNTGSKSTGNSTSISGKIG